MTTFFIQKKSPSPFIITPSRTIMETKCILCGMPLEVDEYLCKTCFEFLKEKYSNKKEFDQILQWHKNQTQLNQKC